MTPSVPLEPGEIKEAPQISLGERAALGYKRRRFVARGRPVPRRNSFCAAGRLRKAALQAGVRVESMVNPLQFLQEVRAEAAKIVWPARRETLITTGIVILMVLAASLFFLVVDQGIRLALGFLLQMGR